MYLDPTGKEWKVVVVTPAGRQKYLEILRKYIERGMGNKFIDGWQLWQNTSVQSDIDYMRSMENDKIKLYSLFDNQPYNHFHIAPYFKFCDDPDTVYIRLDDDICYIQDIAIEELVAYRVNFPKPFVVFGNVINNAIVSHLHQRFGILDLNAGVCGYDRMDRVGWTDPLFIENIHKNFMSKPANRRLTAYFFTEWNLFQYEPFSINCFAFFGKDLQDINDPDEELYISHHQPERLGRPNVVLGSAIVVHFAFHPQRPHLDTKPEYYQFYKDLSEHA